MRTIIVATAAVLFAAVAHADTPPTPRPAGSALDETLREFDDAARKIVDMAEDFPEAKYDFKPTPEVRGFADQILHVAGGNASFVEAARGGKFSEADPPRAQYKTKAQIVALLKKSVADVDALLKQRGAAGMTQPMKWPFGPRMMSPMAYWWEATSHLSEHYGQLVVYYRLNKLVPPESRPHK